jgi:two-component system sensor histidine kinase KdpD
VSTAIREPKAVDTQHRRWRTRLAWILCLAGLPLLTFVLTRVRSHVALGTALMLDLCVVIVVAALGGVRAGVVASLLATGLTNWFLTPPLHQLTVSDAENVVALTVFLFVTVVVSVLVARATRQAHEATVARADAAALAQSAATLLAAPDPMPELLAQITSTFGLRAAALQEMRDGRWETSYASPNLGEPETQATPINVATGDVRLLVWGELPEAGRDVLRAFAAQLATALQTVRLRSEAERSAVLAEADALRTTILRAVSHDFRTPLATIMAASSGLLRPDADITEHDRVVLLRDIESAAYRLDRMVRDLLDISRLQAGAVELRLAASPLEEIVAAALSGVPGSEQLVHVDVDAGLPLVWVDSALLERALANLISNAIAWSPDGAEVDVAAEPQGECVDLHIIDHGPGIPEIDRERVYIPFERSGDRSREAGAGLGLAIARGFVDIIGGVLSISNTPGGGLTMTVRVPFAGDRA